MHRFALLLLFTLTTIHAYYPAVLIHGIGGESSDLDTMKNVIAQAYPGIYVRSVEIGDGFWDSFFWGMNEQVQYLCDELKADPILNSSGGINLLGVSQGGMNARGFTEKCNDPPVRNLILWVSPQGGQFGVPAININSTLDEILEDIADCCIFDADIQKTISFAGYWKDPYAIEEYLEYSLFLADIDNAKPQKNPTYKERILSLRNLSISYSLVDTILQPPRNGWFEFYKPGGQEVIIPLEQSDIWIEDWIGLRTLSETGRLQKFTTTCAHPDYSSDCWKNYFTKYVLPFFGD
eukprot:TRINITY_DN15718_c0_g1_i1.p1 TRINITY_DN15718_c0_g1~~TRINITY_DN15718_c0_g1_i1.p1  ORF type:complete len:293 (-),score=51.99 TRINITY_DN15718_c0_g1_i1:36-914(-)